MKKQLIFSAVCALVFFNACNSCRNIDCVFGECEAGECVCDEGYTGSDCTTEGYCANTCYWAYDGECDDGGTDADWDVCDYGTDCYDCGTRE